VVRHGYLLRSQQSEEQVLEVLRRFRLIDQVTPLRRCLICNGRLETVDKQEVMHRLEPKTNRYYQQFVRCNGCDKLYWQGSHYSKITNWIKNLVSSAGRDL